MDEDRIIAITVGCILLFCGGIILRLAWVHKEEEFMHPQTQTLLDTV
jgi:hypothetical protein